jgi:hypothetical protein
LSLLVATTLPSTFPVLKTDASEDSVIESIDIPLVNKQIVEIRLHVLGSPKLLCDQPFGTLAELNESRSCPHTGGDKKLIAIDHLGLESSISLMDEFVIEN